MISKNFAHVQSSCSFYAPKLFEWDFKDESSPISVYIDSDYQLAINRYENGDRRLKFLWLLESPEFNGNSFDFIQNNVEIIQKTFEGVFTYSDEIKRLGPKFHKIYTTNSWIKEPKIYEKNKLISMIVSNKAYTPLQIERVSLAYSLIGKIDIFGRGFKEIENKEEGLKDYMFSICVENCIYDSYFTEKILDCFATGTVPIYKGTKKILDYFDGNGIIFLDDLKDLTDLTPELFFSKKEAIERNFNILNEYILIDDFLYKFYFSKYKQLINKNAIIST